MRDFNSSGITESIVLSRLTGIPVIAIVAPFGTSAIINYLIGFVIAVAGAFVATLLLGLKEEETK